MADRKQGEADGLQHELRELHSQIAALEAGLKKKPDYGLGEGDPAITRWELDQAILAELRSRVKGLERQLSRISEGTYGICENCGEPIDPGRLAVLPDTDVCVACARSGER
jgi:RNA polymerase-binding transcription factor DksA